MALTPVFEGPTAFAKSGIRLFCRRDCMLLFPILDCFLLFKVLNSNMDRRSWLTIVV